MSKRYYRLSVLGLYRQGVVSVILLLKVLSRENDLRYVGDGRGLEAGVESIRRQQDGSAGARYCRSIGVNLKIDKNAQTHGRPLRS